MFKLETNRLILRDMQPADEAAFVAISQESKSQRFYSESDCDLDKYRQLTKLFIEQANEHPRIAYQLAIEYKATREFIGTVCLRRIIRHRWDVVWPENIRGMDSYMKPHTP